VSEVDVDDDVAVAGSWGLNADAIDDFTAKAASDKFFASSKILPGNEVESVYSNVAFTSRLDLLITSTRDLAAVSTRVAAEAITPLEVTTNDPLPEP
jgi:hypothetical protein